MKAIFSYWSKADFEYGKILPPYGNIPHRYNLYSKCLSVLLACKHYEEVELYTDTQGIKYLIG